jgi:hypothetical protein
MRDWSNSLLPASWNGMPFHVETESESTGLRLPTRQIPNGTWAVENFGRHQRKYKISAYLAEEQIEAAGQALLAASETGEPGLLALPMAGLVNVRIVEMRRQFHKDQLGFQSFDIEAQEEPQALSSVSTNSARAAIYGFTQSLLAPVAEGFATRLADAAFSPAALDRIDEQGVGLASRLFDVRDALGLTGSARDAVEAGFDAVLPAAATLQGDPTGYAVAVLSAAQVLGEQADPDPVGSIVAALPLADRPWVPGLGQAGKALGIVDDAFDLLASVSTVLIVAEATSRQTFVARTEAVQARAVVAGVIDVARAKMAGAEASAGQVLSALDAQMGLYLKKVAADLAPLIQVGARVSMPASWWSWRLHGRIDPQDEMRSRARAPASHMMPLSFQTIAPKD